MPELGEKTSHRMLMRFFKQPTEPPGRRRSRNLQVSPVVAGVLPPHDADSALERLAAQPQFAVERHVGQPGDEPVGGKESVALPRQELLAIPVCPHAVELFAQPPAGDVGIRRPGFGQQERRHGRLGFG